jgi:aspartate/methionine/tyrosine aminotransferase
VDVAASGLDGREFALRLLDEQKVAVAPGTTFGELARNHVRISFAAHEDEIKEGMRRLCEMIGERAAT